MRLFSNNWRRGRVSAFLLAGVLAVEAVALMTAPSRADIIITDTLQASSASTTAFGGADSHSATMLGLGNLTQSSASSSAFGESASGQAQSNLGSVTSPIFPFVTTITGHVSNTGTASSSNSGGMASTSGSGAMAGSITLTKTPYLVSFSANGTASDNGTFSGASASFSFDGVNESVNNGFAGSNSFSTGTMTGILNPGTYPFNANAIQGITSGSNDNSSADFTIMLTPQQLPTVPEPATLTLVGAGSLALAGFGWVRRRKPVAV